MNLHKLKNRLPAIHTWLTAAGAECLSPTNPWEVLRFRAAGATHVVYFNKKDQVSMTDATREILNAFFQGTHWSAGVAVARRKRGVDETTLRARDGDGCFLCGEVLGDDATIEHLVPVVHGGPNHISNKVLAHQACNQRLGHLSLPEKLALRDKVRHVPAAAPSAQAGEGHQKRDKSARSFGITRSPIQPWHVVCDCPVAPWESCAHTDAAEDNAFRQMISTGLDPSLVSSQ